MLSTVASSSFYHSRNKIKNSEGTGTGPVRAVDLDSLNPVLDRDTDPGPALKSESGSVKKIRGFDDYLLKTEKKYS